jgi:hypothetical protein
LIADTEPWTVHTAAPPVGLVQACTACGHTLQDNTAWAEGRVAVPEGQRGGMTWWPAGERIAQLGICTLVLPDRPLDADERLCVGAN